MNIGVPETLAVPAHLVIPVTVKRDEHHLIWKSYTKYINHEPPTTQMGVKTNRTSFLHSSVVPLVKVTHTSIITTDCTYI